MKKNSTVIIVEGKTDTIKLKSIFPNIETIETNGFDLTNEIINMIKIVKKDKEVICFLDPDGPGNRIRSRIIKEIPDIKHAFIDIKLIKSKKIGVAEANAADIKKSLENLITFTEHKSTISWKDYLDLELNTKVRRKKICNFLKIPLFNHKQLFNILNMLSQTKEDINKILGE